MLYNSCPRGVGECGGDASVGRRCGRWGGRAGWGTAGGGAHIGLSLMSTVTGPRVSAQSRVAGAGGPIAGRGGLGLGYTGIVLLI